MGVARLVIAGTPVSWNHYGKKKLIKIAPKDPKEAKAALGLSVSLATSSALNRTSPFAGNW